MTSYCEQQLLSKGIKNACKPALEWLLTQPDLAIAWDACDRADWMLWLAARVCPRPVIVLAACDCAETSLLYLKDEGLRAAQQALETTRRWARGEATIEEVRSAARSASSASAAAAVYAADCAARKKALRSMSDLVRQHIPASVIKEIFP